MRIVPLLILFFASSSLTMVPEDFFQNQLAECKQSILEQVDQYILILPSELGCLPCQYIHAFWQSSKYNHVEQRKKQLAIMQSQVTKENFFCATDLLKYIKDEMGEFNGEYGKKFLQSCTRKLENLIILLKKNLLTCIVSEDNSKNLNCSICNIKPANMRFLCGHALSCQECEENRRYHCCLFCDQENSIEEILNNSIIYARREADCSVCFKSDQTLCYLAPCFHAGTCNLCVKQVTKCPLCCAQIDQSNIIKLDDYEKTCVICKTGPSNIIYDCNHISTCADCESKASQNTCPKCSHNANKDQLTQIYI